MKIIAILVLVAACGGATEAAEGESHPEALGWCCDGLCGLSGEDSNAFERCSCDGAETASEAEGRGECVDRP
jgi:hypothetical protein